MCTFFWKLQSPVLSTRHHYHMLPLITDCFYVIYFALIEFNFLFLYKYQSRQKPKYYIIPNSNQKHKNHSSLLFKNLDFNAATSRIISMIRLPSLLRLGNSFPHNWLSTGLRSCFVVTPIIINSLPLRTENLVSQWDHLWGQ